MSDPTYIHQSHIYRAINITPSSQVVKTFQNEESATNWPVTQVYKEETSTEI